MGIILSVLILLFLLALVISLPVLLPPIRRWTRSSPMARIIVVFIFGAATFLLTGVISFIVMSYVSTTVMIFKFWYNEASSALTTEVFLRHIIPPLLSLSCYTTETICNLVNQREGIGFYYETLRSGFFIGIITVPINVFLVRRFTRPL